MSHQFYLLSCLLNMGISFWNNLPDIALIDIYGHLDDDDRHKMSMVCKNWLRIFHTPSLWRRRQFNLGGYYAHIAQEMACKFAAKHGQDLRYMTINSGHPSYHSCSLFQAATEKALAAFQGKARIHHFILRRLEIDRFWRLGGAREKLVSCLCRFFKSQRHIKVFDMTSSLFPLIGGCRMMEALAFGSDNTLQSLHIIDFFHHRLSAYNVNRFKKAISRLVNLKVLALNYNCFSEKIFLNLITSGKGGLEKLKMKVNRHDPHAHRIPSQTWIFVKQACPRLEVSVNLDSIGMSTEIISILSLGMPLRELIWWTGFDDGVEWRLSDTLSHLVDHFSMSLETVNIEFDNNNEPVDDALLHFVKKCPKIRSLQLNAYMSTTLVDNLCKEQMNGKINLSKFHVTVCGLTELQTIELMLIKDKYQPMIADKGLDFIFSSDLINVDM